MLNGKKILITSCAGLGDLIMFTPALRKLKEMYPNCYITFVTNAKYRESLSGIPYIDRVICIYRKKALGRFRILGDIMSQDYAIFIDWQPQLLLASWLLRVPNRVGTPKEGHKLTALLTRKLTRHVFDSPQYAAQTNAQIFSEALGCDIIGDMTKCDISIPKEIHQKQTEELLVSLGMDSKEKFLLLSSFSGLEQRDWPIDNIKRFLEMYNDQYDRPIIMIGLAEKAELVKDFSAHNLLGKTPLPILIELVRRAQLLITVDSGPMHIAGALDTPVIGLFSKDLPSRWAPKRKCRPITLNLPCSPCNDDTARHCPTVECMRNIHPQMVMDALESLDKELGGEILC